MLHHRTRHGALDDAHHMEAVSGSLKGATASKRRPWSAAQGQRGLAPGL